MSEKFKLYKNIENFIDAECAYKKNSPFIVSFKKEMRLNQYQHSVIIINIKKHFKLMKP